MFYSRQDIHAREFEYTILKSLQQKVYVSILKSTILDSKIIILHRFSKNFCMFEYRCLS